MYLIGSCVCPEDIFTYGLAQLLSAIHCYIFIWFYLMFQHFFLFLTICLYMYFLIPRISTCFIFRMQIFHCIFLVSEEMNYCVFFQLFFPYEIGPRHAKTCLQAYADSKGPYQPVHLHSLIRPSLSTNRIIEYCRMNEWPVWYLAHTQVDLNWCILHMFKGTFLFDVT